MSCLDPTAERPGGEGPDVYRLAQAFTPERAAGLVEQALGGSVAGIHRDPIAGSHAVFYVELADGLECVVRIATHPEHDLALEIWASEQCRALGVPVPEVLACEPTPSEDAPPYVISRRAPGVSAYGAALTNAEREAVFEDLGAFASLFHRLELAGSGSLAPTGCGYAGRASSLWEHLVRDLEARLGALPVEVLTPGQALGIRARFHSERDRFERVPSVLVHGDYRFKNTLVLHSRVSAILDFEMAIAGDPAMDVAWLLYSDGRGDADLDAILRGYGPAAALLTDGDSRKRLLLYQILYGLGHLWWEAEFRNAAGVQEVLSRLQGFEDALRWGQVLGADSG